VDSPRTPSSRAKIIGGPCFCVTGIGTTSRSNLPAARAAAAAAAIQLHAGHFDRQARLQRRPAADAGRLAARIGLRHDDILDARRPSHDANLVLVCRP
jgi:hypothetical protein